MKPLHPWNPLDYVRLLWWLCITPQKLKAHRRAHGKQHEYRVGKWLTSTLMWLPFFLPMLACAMERLPFTYEGKQPNFTRESVYIALLWLISGLLTTTKPEVNIISWFITLLGFLRTFVIVLIHSSRTAAGEMALPFAMIGLMYLSMMLADALIYESVTKDKDLPLILSPAYLLGGVSIFSDELPAQQSIRSLGFPKMLRKSIITGKPSLWGYLVLSFLVLLYAFVVWVSFLEGWRVI